MPYIPPENVIAPADYWQHQVPPMIPYNGGPGDFSVAEGTWNGEPCLAIRWNGDDQGGTGFPTVGPTRTSSMVRCAAGAGSDDQDHLGGDEDTERVGWKSWSEAKKNKRG